MSGRLKLKETEALLTQCATKWQFRLFASGQDWGFPLVNRENVEPTFVAPEASARRVYNEWLVHGSWWSRMDEKFK